MNDEQNISAMLVLNNSYELDIPKIAMSQKWLLRLYIAGQSSKSLTALANLKRLCKQNLNPDNYQIEVVDLLDNPYFAERDQIIAIPTLVRLVPTPMKKIIGDLSNSEKVHVILEFPSEG